MNECYYCSGTWFLGRTVYWRFIMDLLTEWSLPVCYCYCQFVCVYKMTWCVFMLDYMMRTWKYCIDEKRNFALSQWFINTHVLQLSLCASILTCVEFSSSWDAIHFNAWSFYTVNIEMVHENKSFRDIVKSTSLVNCYSLSKMLH